MLEIREGAGADAMNQFFVCMSLGAFGVALVTASACNGDVDRDDRGTGGNGAAPVESGTDATGGGTAATGGSDAGDITPLGRACATDADCGSNLTCAKPDSGIFLGEGPAHGYCTRSCAEDVSVCALYEVFNGPAATCIVMGDGSSYCFEGCKFGPNELTAFDSDKCHGRPEVACSPVFDEFGYARPACLPQCNSDADCGAGLGCNPRTGTCGANVATGDPVGTPCGQPVGGKSTCKGECVGFVHVSGEDPFTFMCAESCTVGAPSACGWSGNGAAPAACLFSSTIVSGHGGPGAGDLGSCDQLCNDNCDCSNPDLVCTAWTGANADANQAFFQREGFCADPLEDNGIQNPGIPCDVADASTDAPSGD
jgi:hypothetical protein